MRNPIFHLIRTGLFLLLLTLSVPALAAEDYTNLQYAFGTQGIRVPDWNVPAKRNAEGTVVAILDSGVDYTHPDLQSVMWTDGLRYAQLRAFGGSQYGVSVAGEGQSSDNVMDVDGHGTHVAGIVGAAWNGFGISGGANGVRLMVVQTGAESDPRYDAVIRGLRYVLAARKAGVPVVAVNLSWGGSLREIEGGPELNDLVTQLGEAGVVTVFAAGNGGMSLDYSNQASLWLRSNPYVLVVGSSNRQRESDSTSHYSEKVVHVFAPGQDILSTVPLKWKGPAEDEGEGASEEGTGQAASGTAGQDPWRKDDPDRAYALMSGTSMATPSVASMLAVLALKYPGESADRLAARVVGTAVSVSALKGKCITGGIASLEAALSQQPVPVLQQAFCEGSRIQIRGHFFGTIAGVLQVADQAAQILTRGDREITAVAPAAFTGRECRVSIQRADGKSGSRIMDFTGTFGKLEAVVPEGMQDMAYIRVASLVAFQGKLYAAGNNEQDVQEGQSESRLYCIDPEAGRCRRVATYPTRITKLCVAGDQLVMLVDQTLCFLSADGQIRKRVDVSPYQPVMAAQAGHELVVLCTWNGAQKLCVFRDGRLSPLSDVGGICSELLLLADVTVSEDSAFFLYRNGGILQVSSDLKTSIRQMSTSGQTPLTLSMVNGIPWVGITNDNDVLTLCPAEQWTAEKSKGYLVSSELFLLPRSAVLGNYLYLIGLTPSLHTTLILRRIRIGEENPAGTEMPLTGEPARLPALATLLVLSLLALGIVYRSRR
ncbi:MAG: S8 family serine peptidase [Clostridia bacterium]|nr:S8 family serine peptidase [Clostridia bacterium]